LLTQKLTRIARRLIARSDTAPLRGAAVSSTFGQRGHAGTHQQPLPMGYRDLGPLYVLIRGWNRPLYLWACLDSLYRFTRYPCRFVFVDNASTDPLVRSIVAGFERRGFFHRVHFMNRNHAGNQRDVLDLYRPEMGRYFALVDADIVVQQGEPDWLQCMIELAESDPKLAALGSAIDPTDFIDPDWARSAAPTMPPHQVHQLIKAGSPERRTPVTDEDLINPFPPAGRLMLLRTDVIDRVGLLTGNRRLCNAIRDIGYGVGIATRARHRHLSLLNFFDYPDYDFANVQRYLQDG
jgi:hypothetical protein